jgi:hypothetical protein
MSTFFFQPHRLKGKLPIVQVAQFAAGRGPNMSKVCFDPVKKGKLCLERPNPNLRQTSLFLPKIHQTKPTE